MVESNKTEDLTSEFTNEINKELKDDSDTNFIKPKIDILDIQNVVEESDLIAKETWEDLLIKDEIQKGLLEMNYTKPSKIQAISIALLNKTKKKPLIAQSNNGSGKTASFGIPAVSRVDESINSVQVIIFEHTREMVNHTVNLLTKIAKYTKVRVAGLLTDKVNNNTPRLHRSTSYECPNLPSSISGAI